MTGVPAWGLTLPSAGLSGLGQGSTSTMGLDIEQGFETGLRDGGSGGTVEADMEERGLETPMMSVENNDSSCPFWLRKVSWIFILCPVWV